MSEKKAANISEQDWENLRLQLKTLVDIYCDLNEDTYQIKHLMKKVVKALCVRPKAKSKAV